MCQPPAVLAESFPDLKSSELFLSLHHNLTETEQRIALARNYYNDIIETYNNRRERFPENLIAAVTGLRELALFAAEDFERAVVDVRFVEQGVAQNKWLKNKAGSTIAPLPSRL